MPYQILSQIILLLFTTLFFQDITRLSRNKRSPFLAACVGGPTETAQLLIDKEADVNKAGHVSALNIVTHNFETINMKSRRESLFCDKKEAILGF